MNEPAPPAPPAATPPATTAPAPAAVPPRRRPWRWLAALLAGTVVLLLAASGGALWWSWSHPAALPWLLQHVPGLSVQGVQGTLQRGTLQIDSLDLQLPADAGRLRASGLHVEGLVVRLRPRPGTQAAVSLRALRIDRLQFNSGAPSGQPLQAPADLRLPIDLQIDQLSIGVAQIDQQPPLRQLQARLALGADGGRLHQLAQVSGVLELGSADAPAPLPWQADLQIGTAAPMPLQATLALQRAAAGRHPAWQATLNASGPLARLDARLQLAGQGPTGTHPSAGTAQTTAKTRSTGQARPNSAAAAVTALPAAPRLQARATVLPFAAWPLADLALQTEALDLAALSPLWPQTRLAGHADIQTAGLDQPASITAQLSNSLPGAWDQGRLPVRSLALAASGNPSQTDRLTLDRFDLQLGAGAGEAGAAGRISGQGRWLGDALSMDLQLDALRPARLHRRAADLLLSGPVQLQATGLPVPQASAAAPAPRGPASVPGGVSGGVPSHALPASAASSSPNATGRSSPSAPVAPVAPGAAVAAGPQLAVVAQLNGRLLDGTGGPVQLRLKGDVSQSHLRLLQADATAGAAHASGTLDARAVAAGWQLRGQLTLQDFDPRPWWRGADQSVWRRGPHRVSAALDAKLLWQDAASRPLAADTLALDRLLAAVDGQASLQIGDSLLAGVPLSGRVELRSSGPVAEVDGRLNLAGNQLTLAGHGGGEPAADEWQFGLQAPALAALAPLGAMLAELAPAAADAWPRSGSLNASLKTAGRWPAMRTQGEASASGLSTALGSLQSATLSVRTGGHADAALRLQLRAQGLARGEQRLDRVTADINGSPRAHTLRLVVDSPVRPPAWSEALLGPAGSGTRFESEAQGSWTPPSGGGGGAGGGNTVGGSYKLQAMALKAGARDAQGGSRPWLAAQGLSGALMLDAAGQLQSLQAEPGRVQLLETALNWSQLQWRADGGAGRLDVVAQLETIAVAPLLARLQPDLGWGGALTIGGRIDIHSATRFDADLVLERIAGDLDVTDELGVKQALGLSDLRLALSAHDGLWQIAQGLAGRRVGTLVGAQVLRSTPERRWPGPDAPLQGLLEARVANLGVWGAWLPPGWRLSGRLDTEAQLSGTLGAAEVNGSVRGSDLGLRNLLQGVSLTDGQLNLVLAGDTARIEKFSFQGGAGRLDATGSAVLGADPTATLRVVADKFRVLGRIDRRVVVSGDTVLKLDRERLQLDGALVIDEGLIDISRSGAPSLDDDVVVSRGPATPSGTANGQALRAAAAPAPTPLRNAQVNVKLGLGQQLRLRGQGVDTLLRGDLALTSPGGRLALNGTVGTHEGLYAAYGQKLEISRGNVIFTGAIDNPRLDVLALRPNLDVEVGVSITGTASNPRIRLYSEPDMADYDKLSWLVMGRASEGLGTADAALLQRAAFALLAGDGQGPTDQVLSALGLTEFSVKQTEGDTRDTVVSLGKQLSRRWWVGYERGVHATTGTWQVIYRVAQRFTLRAQSGEENALDLIWTWRW